jgi:hypothetical protein
MGIVLLALNIVALAIGLRMVLQKLTVIYRSSEQLQRIASYAKLEQLSPRAWSSSSRLKVEVIASPVKRVKLSRPLSEHTFSMHSATSGMSDDQIVLEELNTPETTPRRTSGTRKSDDVVTAEGL